MMKKWSVRILVILIAFGTGLITVQLSRFFVSIFNKAESSKCNQQDKPLPTKPILISSTLEFTSPNEIRRSILLNPEANLKMIWMYWGVGTKVKGFGNLMFKDFLEKCSKCEAEIYGYDFDGDGSAETLLHIEDEIRQESRFMIFKPVEEKDGEFTWKLLRYVDHDFCKYGCQTTKYL